MFDSNYFRSLSVELDSLKNRVRNFIEGSHWLTDGEWKESVLRTFLRRNLPKSVEIGRGFVLSEESVSKQIDLLIYDSAKPVLFRDGDLVFLTPDAVLGLIEVKTSLDLSSLRESLEKLCDNAELLEPSRRIVGLFSYEDKTGDISRVLTAIRDVVKGRGDRVVHCICMGDSKLIRFWNLDPESGRKIIDSWHAYQLEKTAPAYFIHNVIEQICQQSVDRNQARWYPQGGKEANKIGEIALR